MKKKAPPAIAIQPISRKERLVKNLPYLSMMLIPSVLLLIFNYWPMIGLSMAFQNYRSGELFLGPTTQ